jgi:hypothetical protein
VPLARILVFALALTHSVGLADLVVDDACAEACSDDGCGKDCAPGDACRCHCPSTMPVVGAHMVTVVKLDPPRVVAPCAVDQRMHASPDPREILHVPRHAA